MIGIHITKEAKNTTIDNCELINCSMRNEGENTKVLKTRFIRTLNNINDWSQKWWGQIVIGLAVLLLAYIFRIK